MEFEFNKVNLNIKMQMQEEISTSKIQTGEKSSVLKKLKDDEKSPKDTPNKRKRKEKISVYATKSTEASIGVQAEKVEILNEENSKGINLDAKK